MVIGKMLERLEVECAIVGDGSRAVEAVQQDRFELLLMDCQMPEMDGYEATRLIRQWERTHEKKLRRDCEKWRHASSVAKCGVLSTESYSIG